MDVAKLVPPEKRKDPKALVAALVFRLFQDPLTSNETGRFESFLEGKTPALGDAEVRELLQLMMSTPQYQLT
jgi:hypothetical protein